MTIAVVLWDFGDTLVDERWMLQAPPDFAEWPTAWTDVVTERAHDWNIGRLTEADIFRELADRTRMTLPEIESHAAACCRSIRFHPAAWRSDGAAAAAGARHRQSGSLRRARLDAVPAA